MADALDFLDEAEKPQEIVVEKPVEVVAEVVKPEVVAEVVKPEVKTDTTVVEVKKPDGSEVDNKTVPLRTFLDMVDENKSLKNQMKKTNIEEDTFEIPDPTKDPAGHAVYQDAVHQAERLNDRMNNSERFARLEHGAELVNKAKEWGIARIDKDAGFARLVTDAADPYAEVVRLYNEEQEMEEFRTFKANKGKPPAEGAAKPVEQPNKPVVVIEKITVDPKKPVVETKPNSIVDDTSAAGGKNGGTPTGAGVAFNNAIPE